MQRITNWQAVADEQVPTLLDDEIHLWLLEAEQHLSPRAMSALAHAQLGRLLNAYAARSSPPAIARTEYGKPYVLDAGYPHFNLSHAGHCIAFAFSRQQELGVDVENVRRRRSSLALAERFFAMEELQALAALEPSERDAAFVRLWTGKEAVLKALGRGLAFGLHRLSFSLDDGASEGRLVAITDEAGPLDAWQVCRFEAAGDYAGALAWSGPARQIRALRLHAAPLGSRIAKQSGA